MKIFTLILLLGLSLWILWTVGNDKSILVGIDPFIGDNGQHLLPQPIMDYLAEFGFVTLAHVERPTWSLAKMEDTCCIHKI